MAEPIVKTASKKLVQAWLMQPAPPNAPSEKIDKLKNKLRTTSDDEVLLTAAEVDLINEFVSFEPSSSDMTSDQDHTSTQDSPPVFSGQSILEKLSAETYTPDRFPRPVSRLTGIYIIEIYKRMMATNEHLRPNALTELLEGYGSIRHKNVVFSDPPNFKRLYETEEIGHIVDEKKEKAAPLKRIVVKQPPVAATENLTVGPSDGSQAADNLRLRQKQSTFHDFDGLLPNLSAADLGWWWYFLGYKPRDHFVFQTQLMATAFIRDMPYDLDLLGRNLLEWFDRWPEPERTEEPDPLRAVCLRLLIVLKPVEVKLPPRFLRHCVELDSSPDAKPTTITPELLVNIKAWMTKQNVTKLRCADIAALVTDLRRWKKNYPELFRIH